MDKNNHQKQLNNKMRERVKQGSGFYNCGDYFPGAFFVPTFKEVVMSKSKDNILTLLISFVNPKNNIPDIQRVALSFQRGSIPEEAENDPSNNYECFEKLAKLHWQDFGRIVGIVEINGAVEIRMEEDDNDV